MRFWYLIIGSIAGGFARYFVAGEIYKRTGTGFPWGTLIVNVTGCLLIGLFNSLAEEKFILSPEQRILMMTGFCGAYTTFSTFILETSGLLRDGEFFLGTANVAVSVLAGYAFFRLGAFLVKII
jgi:CrcB protein